MSTITLGLSEWLRLYEAGKDSDDEAVREAIDAAAASAKTVTLTVDWIGYHPVDDPTPTMGGLPPA